MKYGLPDLSSESDKYADSSDDDMATEKIAWPKWDGKTSNFSFFLTQLETRAELAVEASMKAKTVCFQMVQCLPPEKQHLVQFWFKEGGPKKDWNWKDFAAHFALQYEDKQAKKTALEELSRMRMGAAQYFTDFMSDFEYKLALAGGSGWPAEARLGYLETGLNGRLRAALVTLDLPEDYNAWTEKVKLTAGRLEGLADYRPKGSTQTSTYFLSQPGSVSIRGGSDSAKGSSAGKKDFEGDTIMGNTSINALVAALTAAMRDQGSGGEKRNSGSSDSRPRAQWKSSEAYQKLVEKDLCGRCEKPGHWSRNCPTYKAARRPAQVTRVSTAPAQAAPTGKVVESENSDSENE